MDEGCLPAAARRHVLETLLVVVVIGPDTGELALAVLGYTSLWACTCRQAFSQTASQLAPARLSPFGSRNLTLHILLAEQKLSPTAVT